MKAISHRVMSVPIRRVLPATQLERREQCAVPNEPLGSSDNVPRFVRARGEASCHLIHGGTRRMLPSASCIFDWRLGIHDAEQIERSELDGQEWLPPIAHLVSTPEGGMGFVQDGFYRRFSETAVAQEMGFDLTDVRPVSVQRLRCFPPGPPLRCPEPNLVLLWGPELTPVDTGCATGRRLGAWLVTFAVQVLNLSSVQIEGLQVLLRGEGGSRYDTPCSEARSATSGEEITYRTLLRDIPAGRYTASCVLVVDNSPRTIPISGLHPDSLYPRYLTF